MPEKEKSVLRLQYTAAITGCITIVGYGTVLSWASPAISHLISQESDIIITVDQSSWIASLYSLGFLIGFLLNPIFVDRIGRKRTLIMFAIPQIASWLLIILAKSHISLYIGRLIGGAGYGGGLCAMTIYIMEIGNKNNRGIFFVLIRLSIGIGFMLTMILGAYFTYRQMNIILLMLPVFFIIIFLFMPDSSYFLEINQKIEEEELRKIKSSETEEDRNERSKLNSRKEEDFHFPQESKLNSNEEAKNCNYQPNKFSKIPNFTHQDFIGLKGTNLWKLFSEFNNRKALALVVSTGLINIFSGQGILGCFGQQILTHKEAPMDPEKGMVLLAALNVIACIISIQIIEIIRRKTLLIFTGLVCAISLFFVGLFFYLEKSSVNITYFGWVPIFFLSVYDILISVGPSNIFYIYQGEFFKHEIKSTALTVTKLIFMGFGFLAILNYQAILKITGMDWYFWICGSCCALGAICVYFMVPETQGKSLQEIQNCLEKKRFFSRVQDCFEKKSISVIL